MQPMLILGIDPGTHTTGYGLIEKNGSDIVHVDNGIISLTAHKKLPERLNHIFSELEGLIKKFGPDAMAIEDVFVASNARSALVLGHARGTVILAAARTGLEVYEYSTRSVKQALVGFGGATKEQVADMVRRLLKLPEAAALDASDALAVAICHANTLRF